MRFDHVQLYAEQAAEDFIESVRKEILTLISSSEIDGIKGKWLRDDIGKNISRMFQNAPTSFNSHLSNAWDRGIARANRQFRIGVPSTLTRDVSAAEEKLTYAFKKLRASIISDTQLLLARSTDKEQIIKKIGQSIESGNFKDYAARMRGVVWHELDVTEAGSYAARAKEVAKIKVATRSDDTKELNRKRIEQGKRPVSIKIWRHSGFGNPPRENHIAMDGKGVVAEHNFRLEGNDGEVYGCYAPKDSNLPLGETAHCRCSVTYRTLFVSEAEEKELRQMSEDTGGFNDPRWK